MFLGRAQGQTGESSNKKANLMQYLLLVILRLMWGILSDCIDTFLVWMHLKHWPSIGRARWNRKRRADPRSQAWQRLIVSTPGTPMPCPHQDTVNTSQGRVCPQCGANISNKAAS